MERIPPTLVASLRTLGLFESEAKVYSALVMFKFAEAKDLVEYVDISKPSVYESLRTLEERGLVVETNHKPLIYQAIPPEIAVKLLADTYAKAAGEALEGLQGLEKKSVTSKASSALWSIYGSETIGYKIEDMVRHASASIYCLTPEKYLRYVEPAAGKGLQVTLSVISEDPAIKERLVKLFGDKAEISAHTPSDIIEMSAYGKIGATPDLVPGLIESLELMDFSSQFMLVTDESEFLYIPPISGEDIGALNTTNKAFILSTKFLFMALDRRGVSTKAEK